MGEGEGDVLRRAWFVAWVAAIVGLVVLQSIVHLALVLDAHRVDTLFDLDRSNGLPDVLSTLSFAAATVGAAALSVYDVARRIVAVALAVGLALLGVADLLHLGAHPTPTSGRIVIVVVLGVGVLLSVFGHGSMSRVRATLVAAGCVLACSFLVIGLDRVFQRLERERGDPIAEYQIVVKEGLELLGWSLVALALWDEALRRRLVSEPSVIARASRVPARRTRRAA